MSNRGRQNVASLLTKDLYYDWRLGAEWFESLLIDYDPASNYGNVSHRDRDRQKVFIDAFLFAFLISVAICRWCWQ